MSQIDLATRLWRILFLSNVPLAIRQAAMYGAADGDARSTFASYNGDELNIEIDGMLNILETITS